MYIDELVDIRKEAREKKNWKLSDDIRNYLDTKLVFIIDHKEYQEVHYLTDSYFNKIYSYNKGDAKKWEETAIQKIERLHNIKFETNRKFVEWNIQQDKRAEKRFEAWIYSTLQSGKSDKSRIENIPTFK